MGGSLAQPPFSSFVRILASQEGYADFVETGTYLGETTRWAADVFSRVHTVEINPKFQEQALETCADRNNISFFIGRTEERLPDILRSLQGPTVFWLDAHAGGGWYGDKDDCPLLAELKLITARGVIDDFVIIDDARGFTAPPPPPFDPDAWPPIHSVLDAIDPRRERYIVIIADAIVCAPIRLRRKVIDLCATIRPTI